MTGNGLNDNSEYDCMKGWGGGGEYHDSGKKRLLVKMIDLGRHFDLI